MSALSAKVRLGWTIPPAESTRPLLKLSTQILRGVTSDRAGPNKRGKLAPPGPPDEAAVAFVRPMVEKASLALCVNEAWLMLACVAIAGVLLVPFARDRADPKGG
jgi:hypothetical protein